MRVMPVDRDVVETYIDMYVQVTCPKCGAKHIVSTDPYFGDKTICPECRSKERHTIYVGKRRNNMFEVRS